MSNDLLKQAIADARALRESAYNLAKDQIAESFGPRVQEMIRLKLSEMDDTGEDMPVDEMHDPSGHEEQHSEGMMAGKKHHPGHEGVDESTLDELLSELEEEAPIDEAKKADDEGEKPKDKKPEGESEEEVELSIEELKDIIVDAVKEVMGKGEEDMPLEPETGTEPEEGPEMADQGDDTLTLDEILAELETDPVEEAKHAKEHGKEEDKHTKEELKEAYKTITTLQKQLVEVNLLNAKLLYVNKLFKAKNLTESQKLKVIQAFDRAETVREAKTIFDTLQDSITVQKPKQAIRESVGFASKAAGIISNRPKPIVQQDDIYERWQVLSGIKKVN